MSTDIPKLATHLALAAVHGGVAAEVVALLTGSPTAIANEGLKARAESGPATSRGDELECSGPRNRSKEAESNEDLSSLIKEVSDRLASKRAGRKPGSS